LFAVYTSGAQDTLPEVKVEAPKEKISDEDKLNTFAPGQKVLHIDSIVLQQYKFQNISNLLSQQTSAFVKSYGFNGLATLNFRGSSSAQSLVLWNGVPLQNAALGLADISTLPVALIDRVNIVYGGSAALWGSGNVGGALLLENDIAQFDSAGRKGISVSLGAGSYSQYAGGARLSFSNKRWYVSVNGFVQSASNDFTYSNTLDQEVRMPHSRISSGGFMLNGAYRINKYNTLSISAWYQHYDREIPPALFESASFKDRQDESKRVMVHYKNEKARHSIYFKSAFIEDKLFFTDPAINLSTANISYQSYSEWGIKRQFSKNHSLLIFIPFNYSWLRNAIGNQSRTGIGAAYAINLMKEKLNISLQASEQFIDNKAVFLPGINTSYSIFKWLKIRTNIQKSYRAPTLNELYYQPGGNSNLKPENGWSQDGGYSLRTNPDNKLILSHDLSVFNRDIRDWILWYGGAIFTPHNIARVNSRGIETENMLRYRLGRATLHLGLNTAYVIATTRESVVPNDGSIGKQIPYTPRYNGQLNVGFTYKGLYFNYNHTYTGYRFYTTDESAWIKPYSTANVQIMYALRLKTKKSLQFSLQINNLLDRDYFVVAQRPMPGINWLVGLRFNLIN
jgi:iron complex outermembrane receptor protein